MPVLKPNPAETLPSGPWLGVRDGIDSSTTDPEWLNFAQNVYPDPQYGSWEGRPGSVVCGADGEGAQLGIVGHRRIQGGYQYIKHASDGTITHYTILVCGGKFYTYDFLTDTYTEAVVGGAFSGTSITLDQDSRVFFVEIADVVFVTDGVNTPFTWDGTTNGGLVKLTNCPVLYGQPWVYYAKVFGYMQTDRSKVVWSEENDPTIGYLMVQYNNVWDSPGQDPNALVAGIGTNDATYFYRDRSTIAVSGPVDTAFSTSGTRANVSSTLGAGSTAAVIYYNKRIYLLDSDARFRVQSGDTIEDDTWRNARETIGTLSLGLLDQACVAALPDLELVLFGVPESGALECSVIIAIAVDDRGARFAGIWRGAGSPWSFTTLFTAVDAAGAVRLIRGDANGYCYAFGTPNGNIWDDTSTSVDAIDIWDGINWDAGTWALPSVSPVAHALETGYIGQDTDVEKGFVRSDAVFRAATSATIEALYTVPRGRSNPLSTTIVGSGALWDQALWDQALWSASATEAHKAFGYGSNANGRWIKVRYQHQVQGERFGIQRMTVDMIPLTRQPRTP